MLNLPDVTLVMIETREHELASLAIKECAELAKFGEVLVFTDDMERWWPNADRIVHVEDWPNKEGWSRFLWNEVGKYVRTSHLLSIQWDSWIVDPEAWRDEFLRYDYIGAPWWYKDGLNVGNGGFSLRSTALQRYLAKHRKDYPCINAIDDDQLCRKYRPKLMQAGFEWATQEVADHFAFECLPQVHEKVFGFHGIFNWPKVMSAEDCERRVEVAARSPYIRKNAYMWDALVKAYPKAAEIARGADAVRAA
jgi:hypothetical protein